MGINKLNLAIGSCLLLTVAIANCQNCKQFNTKSDPITCDPGTELTYEKRYKFTPDGKTFYDGSCCVPGTPDEAKILAKLGGCQTISGKSSQVEKPCRDSLKNEYVIKGKKLIFDEIKREGDTVYCCARDSFRSSLTTVASAELHEFPHQGNFLRFMEQCGSTVYNKRWLITAAHCVVDHTGSQEPWEVDDTFSIKLGVNLKSASKSGNEYKVIKAVPHPDYSDMKGSPEQKKENPRTYNDIALLQVDRDIEFGPDVKALPIAPAGFDENKYADHVVVLGWGRTDTLNPADTLQKSNFVVHSDERCFKGEKASYPLDRDSADRIFCIGGILDGVWGPSSGQGDSGGPAICRGADGTPLLCGLVSFVGSPIEDCMENQDEENCPPNVFTEVDMFGDWIRKVAGEQDPSTIYKPQLYGEIVKKNEVSHQVRITSSSGKPCGGTLIASDLVVTAASCIAEVDSGKMLAGLKVWSGLSDISKNDGNSHSIKSISILDGFKRNGEPVNVESQKPRVVITDNYYTNNLGVIKLNEPVKAGSNFPTLPNQNEQPSSPAMEYSFPRNMSRGGELRRREFVLLDKEECQARWNLLGYLKMVKKVDDNVLCGVETYSGGSTCDRELGGGLICKGVDGKVKLCGVQTQRLCEFSIPNDFVNVGMHSNWLEQVKNQ